MWKPLRSSSGHARDDDDDIVVDINICKFNSVQVALTNLSVCASLLIDDASENFA